MIGLKWLFWVTLILKIIWHSFKLFLMVEIFMNLLLPFNLILWIITHDYQKTKTSMTPPDPDFSTGVILWFIISVTISTEQKLKFSIKDFFSKFDQIRSLPKKSLMGNFIFLCNVRSLLSKEISPILFKGMGDSLIVNLIL